VTDPQNKPALDEPTFERLLEAAYVLQEHNRKLRILEASLEEQSEQLREQELARQKALRRTKPATEENSKGDGDYTLTLAQIVEAQHQIQMRHLDLDKAMAVVAERVARITGASGAGIGLLDGGMVRYRAGAGSPALPIGTEVPLLKAVCQANVRTGQVIRTPDVDTEFLFDPEPCRARGIHSLVAVPIHHDGNIVGALELYFDRLHGFAEQDIHTCQLMAGLVTEAIGRDAESTLKESVAAERSTMMAAIEKLQPSLTALADAQSAGAIQGNDGRASADSAKLSCWKCGSSLLTREQFCGKCGAARADEAESVMTSLQGKLASSWSVQQAGPDGLATATSRGSSIPIKTTGVPIKTTRSGASDGAWNVSDSELAQVADELSEALSVADFNNENIPVFTAKTNGERPASTSVSNLESEEGPDVPSTAIVKTKKEEMMWGSAAKARDFLEALSTTRHPSGLVRFWRSRRGDFYLAIAIILVVVAIRWGIWSDDSVVATGPATTISGGPTRHKKPAPDADLSAFDKLLIGLGLAEAPDEAPQYKGNPDTQVWVDLHTALYYCPGADLYGKTAKGKLSSQRDAQLDQFEPANRKACD